MKKSIREMSKEFEVFKRNHKLQDYLKYWKVSIISIFIIAFALSASAEIREYEVREEYAMRDLSLAVQLQSVVESSTLVKQEGTSFIRELFKESNQITTDWIKDGRKYFCDAFYCEFE